MKIAYFDCFAGASGDMILGALLDAGLPLKELKEELSRLPLTGYDVSIQKERRGVISGTRVEVTVSQAGDRRKLADILPIISTSALPEGVRSRGEAIFRRLAAAEAKVHGLTVEETHLHEVGAVDAMVDVMGAIIGLNLLGVEEVFSSSLPLGGGTVASAHGPLPVPAPAALELLAMVNAPLRSGLPGNEAGGEVLTPTAAAILTTLATFQRPSMTLERVGYGLGARHRTDLPNALRLWLGETIPLPSSEIILMETNIDDMNPELYGYLMERLFSLGALDVWFTPIQMKKNRPATMVSLLAPRSLEGTMAEVLFQESSTLGVRVQGVERHGVERRAVEFLSSLGRAAVKLKIASDGIQAVSPEYEACRRLAQEHGLPLQEVYRRVAMEAREKLG